MTGGPTVLTGASCILEEVDAQTWPDVLHLDWLRAQHPVMGGMNTRSAPTGSWALAVFRDKRGSEPVGLLEAHPLPGYPGVVNVSIFTDRAAVSAGPAIDAYGLYVSQLFRQGVRLVHHEVLEFNRPVHRIMRRLEVEPSARLREHAYVAGRWWDVLVYSYDARHWQGVLARYSARTVGRPEEMPAQSPDAPRPNS